MIKYERFRQTIREVIQNSELDVGAVFFILKDVLGEVESLYRQQIQKELTQEETEEKNDEC